MIRSAVPAQDGIKFLRIAREFQSQPWTDVIRAADQHPLYPALVALVEPAVAAAIGRGADAWRIAAQLISVSASLALLLPLYHFARNVFDRRVAILTLLVYVLLPAPAEISHDTLSDALGLLAFTTALCLGEQAIRKQQLPASLGCAVASGLGYWVRPELALLPVALCVTVAVRSVRPYFCSARASGSGAQSVEPRTGRALIATSVSRRNVSTARVRAGTWPVFCIVWLALIGTYALIKGDLSEKLALRRAAGTSSIARPVRSAGHRLPDGLNDSRWDFSAKEESARLATFGPVGAGLRAVGTWFEGMGYVFAPLAVWGAIRVRASVGRTLIAVYLLLFTAVLIRHAMGLGYLSGRHVLTLVVATLPWAAAASLRIADRLAQLGAWSEQACRRRAILAVSLLVVLGVVLQCKPYHASRWGHAAAGRWLAANASESEAVLDTRGWAAFVSGRRSYDYWHVRQALTDASLSYIVVGADELAARSRRAATLRAMLAFAGHQVASFPERQGGADVGVLIYRFQRPESWEGLQP
jgi:hypothetical protein